MYLYMIIHLTHRVIHTEYSISCSLTCKSIPFCDARGRVSEPPQPSLSRQGIRIPFQMQSCSVLQTAWNVLRSLWKYTESPFLPAPPCLLFFLRAHSHELSPLRSPFTLCRHTVLCDAFVARVGGGLLFSASNRLPIARRPPLRASLARGCVMSGARGQRVQDVLGCTSPRRERGCADGARGDVTEGRTQPSSLTRR